LSYEWDLGDGSPIITGETVTHRYGDNGSYIARLTVQDDDGGVDTRDIDINVLNQDPVAEAGGPYQTTENVPLTLTGTGNDVPADTLSYSWDFGDGNTSNEINPTHTYANDGEYTVTLTVTDEDGGVGIDTTTVDVGSPPVADAGGPYTGVEGGAITFNGSGSSDPDNDPLVYSWDFGDGNTSNEPNPTHSYADDGNYTVTLEVRDDRGGLDTDSVPVTVANASPTAVAVADPNPVPEGAEVTFDGNGSRDPGSDTLSYSWDFGDGNTSNEIDPTHT
jgi:PKD repeat protein